MHEACSNASHTLFNAREEVNQLKKDEGNSVTVSQEEDSICFWWIGHFQWGISYSLWFQICQSMGDVHQDPWGAAFSQFRTVTITDLQANLPLTRPPPPHTPLASKESCGRLCCNAWLPAENSVRWCLVIFFLFLHWRPSLKMTVLSGGTAKPQHAIVNLTFNTLWSNWVQKWSVHPESS